MRAAICPDAEMLAALLQREGEEVPECAAHLESCLRCRQTLIDLAADQSTWETMIRNLPGNRWVCEPALESAMLQLKNGSPFTTIAEPIYEDGLPPFFLRPCDRPELLGYLGTYEVLEVIGRGGMSIVFKAFDPVLNRLVAIKVLAPQMASSLQARRRFLREGRAAACIADENVVSVYEVNESAGLPYLVMQYVAGPSLQDVLDQTGSLPVREIVRLGKEIAKGLAAAHRQGLIHRDVKPANILLETPNGEPWSLSKARAKLTDFGLARAADDAGCTRPGVIAGTPDYAAPEQARAEPLDARADLFSLGSVLYALCTGHPPFPGGTPLAVLRRVSDESPPPVRTINPDIPQWLEKIVITLHAREPKNRFNSAAEVALLLGQHAAASLRPRRSPPRRIKPNSTTVMALLLLVVAVFVWAVAGGTPSRPARPQSTRQAALAPPEDAKQRNEGTVLETTRSFWALDTPEGPASGEISVDGKTLVVGTWDGTAVVWDTTIGKTRFKLPGFARALRSLAISPDGKTIATATSDRVVRLWDASTGKPKGEFTGHTGRIMGLAFSPDGKTLASAGGDFNRAGELRLWDVATGKERTRVAPFARELWGIAYSPDGESVAVAVGDGTAQIVNASTGKVTATFKHACYARRVAYSPDGKLLAVNYGDQAYVTLWELPGGKERSSWQSHNGSVFTVSFSRDGKRLMTASSDHRTMIWDVTKPQVRAAITLKGHKGQVWFAVFFPDGKTVATGADDKLIRLWSLEGE
jgi:serine/threonine protein kinase